MATTPRIQTRWRIPRPGLPAIIALVLVLAVGISFAVPRLAGSQVGAPNGTPVSVTRGPLIDGISATGKIDPRQQADLTFAATSGRVSAIMVAEGDLVQAGDPLIQLDTRQQRAEVAAAEAALAEAQADLLALRNGATAEEIAAAQAQVAAAQGTLQQTQGSVTNSDIVAAQAAVAEARARLATVQGQPNSDALTRAQAAVSQAQAELERQRAALSAAKEQTRLNVDAQANALRNAQSEFAAARDNLASVEADGDDPLTGAPLTDAGERSYRDAFERAQRSMADADAALVQARVEYETAKQNEITGLADAEARLRTAQAELDTLLKPNADSLAAARAQLASAEANLARLLGDERQGALTAQQANLETAQAQLAQLLADPRASDLARTDARINQARAQLDLAQIKLDDATLRAPFAGIIAQITVAPGEDISSEPPVRLIDTSRYQVQLTVDEVDVARVVIGQPVEVLIDALGEPALRGMVSRIASQAVEGSTVTAYEVVVELDPGERPLKAGMTASATIIAEQRENVLSVPAQAVRNENGRQVVTVVTTGSDGKQQTQSLPVEIGTQFGERVEIAQGLNEGQQVLIP